jgi:hypothetical protein
LSGEIRFDTGMIQDSGPEPIPSEFFEEAVDHNGRAIWQVLCHVAAALDAEARRAPGASFRLAASEAHRGFFPMMRTLPEAARKFGDLRDLFSLYGREMGYVDSPDQSTPQRTYSILHSGEGAIVTLIKSITIANTFYERHRYDDTVVPEDEMCSALAILDEYFAPERFIQTEMAGLYPEAQPVSLTSLKKDVYRWMEAIMEMDQGSSVIDYSNANGRIVVHGNGAIRVTIDSRGDDVRDLSGADEALWGNYRIAMRERGVMTNASSIAPGRANTYTICPGADLQIVLDGLREATMISPAETIRLTRAVRSLELRPSSSHGFGL